MDLVFAPLPVSLRDRRNEDRVEVAEFVDSTDRRLESVDFLGGDQGGADPADRAFSAGDASAAGHFATQMDLRFGFGNHGLTFPIKKRVERGMGAVGAAFAVE